MAWGKALRAFSRLLTYPDDQTMEAAELLYIILQGELPAAATEMSQFGAYLDRHEPWEMEEAFTRTFDVNPACALEVGWHLFGEEYARGMFLVRMREELRKYDLPESAELPDHITHVLAVVGAMPLDESSRFVRACFLPATKKMNEALAQTESPYRHVIACLSAVLQHVWGDGETDAGGTESARPDRHAVPGGVDLLHAFPVRDVNFDCTDGCGGSGDQPKLVQLSLDSIPAHTAASTSFERPIRASDAAELVDNAPQIGSEKR